MTETRSKTQILLARVVVLLMVALILLGLFWYGTSAAVLQRMWDNMLGRPGGPMTFRFILQPVMAAIAALHDGLADARTGRSSYLLTILTNPAKRGGRLYEGLISTSRIILLGLVMDSIYQVIVLKTFYPGEAVIVALALAFVPYLLLRGPIAHIARFCGRGAPADRA